MIFCPTCSARATTLGDDRSRLGVKFDPGGNPRLLVLQRVGVALCRCLDEFLVELLPA